MKASVPKARQRSASPEPVEPEKDIINLQDIESCDSPSQSDDDLSDAARQVMLLIYQTS